MKEKLDFQKIARMYDNADIQALTSELECIRLNDKYDKEQEYIEYKLKIIFYLIKTAILTHQIQIVKDNEKEFVNYFNKIKGIPNATILGIGSSIYSSMGRKLKYKIPLKNLLYIIKSSYYQRKTKKIDAINEYVLLWKAGHYMNAPFFAGGSVSKGIEILRLICKLYPNNNQAKCMLGDALLEIDVREAASVIRRVIDQNPKCYYANLLLEKSSSKNEVESFLKIEDIEKSYGTSKVLNKVNFEINKGETYALLGPNGAGKSTLVNLICGFSKSYSGRIELLGKNIRGNDLNVKKYIGLVTQENALYLDLTVRENLDFHLKIYGVSNRNLRNEKINASSKHFNLDDFMDKKIYKLSGGQKRRVTIAKALIHNPYFLILDEPTTGLDPESRKEFWSIISFFIKFNQLAVLLITHYLDEVEDACQNVLFLNNGKIVANESIHNLRNSIGQELIEVEIKDKNEMSLLLNLMKKDEYKIISESVAQIFVDEKKNNFLNVYSCINSNHIKISRLLLKKTTLDDIYFYYLKGADYV